MLELATKQDYVIYWGTKGFSVRAVLKPSGNLASFVYGWPEDHFEFYFAYLNLSTEEASVLRQKLMDFKVFRESGQKTLRASVTPETIPQLKKAYAFILDEVDRICQAA